jgi:hypothetical protein
MICGHGIITSSHGGAHSGMQFEMQPWNTFDPAKIVARGPGAQHGPHCATGATGCGQHTGCGQQTGCGCGQHTG